MAEATPAVVHMVADAASAVLLQNEAAGLAHVRYAALATFTPAERPRATVTLKVSTSVGNEPRLLVTVALGARSCAHTGTMQLLDRMRHVHRLRPSPSRRAHWMPR